MKSLIDTTQVQAVWGLHISTIKWARSHLSNYMSHYVQGWKILIWHLTAVKYTGTAHGDLVEVPLLVTAVLRAPSIGVLGS